MPGLSGHLALSPVGWVGKHALEPVMVVTVLGAAQRHVFATPTDSVQDGAHGAAGVCALSPVARALRDGLERALGVAAAVEAARRQECAVLTAPLGARGVAGVHAQLPVAQAVKREYEHARVGTAVLGAQETLALATLTYSV